MEDHEVLSDARIEEFEKGLSAREARMRQARLDLDAEEGEIVKGYETLALHKTQREQMKNRLGDAGCGCPSCRARG